jgi:excisionase family DNA binding protein
MPIVLGDVKLFSVTELSETLNINIQTVRKLLNTGKLKGRKLARKWYVTETSLKQYFDGDEK